MLRVFEDVGSRDVNIDLQCLFACASVDGRNLAPIDVI